MSLSSFRGYIWPVTTEEGLEVFKNTSGYYEYGYSRSRFPTEGDVLFFYYGKQIIGFVPVARSAGAVGETYERNEGRNDWKYAVGLAFDEKKEFDPPIPIEELLGVCHVLNGKVGRELHDSFRMAPILSFEECLLLLEIGSPTYKTAKFSKELTPAENSDFSDDLSSTLKGRSVPPERVKQVRFIFRRNQKLIRTLKREYDGICQICGITNLIETESGGFYSEEHHIIPLGEEGYDNLENVAILCPLCHKKLHHSKDRDQLKEAILYSESHRRILEQFGREHTN